MFNWLCNATELIFWHPVSLDLHRVLQVNKEPIANRNAMPQTENLRETALFKSEISARAN